MTNKRGNTKKTKKIVFSDADLLRLLQLQALQVIASDDDSSSDSESGDTKTSSDNQSTSEESPERWRLLPDDIELYDWQTECLKVWKRNSYRGTVKVATGGGKTLFALAAAQKLQTESESDLRLVIVVPTIVLMYQWLDDLRASNIPRSKIALLGDSKTVPDDPDIRIIISVLNTARDKLPELVRRFNWSPNLLLVVDECHRSNAEKAQQIFESNPTYTLGLSATPETQQDDETIPTNEAYSASSVGKALGKIIFEFSLKDSLNAGLLTPFEIWNVGLSLSPEESSKHTSLSREISELRKDLQVAHRRSGSTQGFIAWCQTAAKRKGWENAVQFISMTSERKRLLYRASSRSDLTLRILSSAMSTPDRRVIVFHESIDNINHLFASALDANIPAVLEHSKLPSSLRDKDVNAFRRGIARVIISAKSLVEGFNVPSADIGIIAASSGSVRQRIQSLGRMLRKKESGESAIIFILYIRDTEDESIYGDVDWNEMIGAGRIRYFEWDIDENSESLEVCSLDDLSEQFRETGTPPREYRPSCSEIKDELSFGSEYPAQTKGIELRIDQEGNLRTRDKSGVLVSAPQKALKKILEVNKYRMAVRTPCGHLICRTGEKQNGRDVWIYLGKVGEPESVETKGHVEKLIIRQVAGRKVIAKKDGRNEMFALGPDKTTSKEAGETLVKILEWIRSQETTLSDIVRILYWDGRAKFWIEVSGQRIYYNDANSGLEFAQ